MKNQWDRQAYQKAFSQLKISPELRKELLAMTEKTEKTRKPKKFAMRRLAVAAAVMALAFALAMGANAATGGEMFGSIVNYVQSWTMPDGSKVDMYQGKLKESGETVFFSIETEGDNVGKAIGIDLPEDESENPIITYEDQDGNVVTHQFKGELCPNGEGNGETPSGRVSEYYTEDGKVVTSEPRASAEK